jgi:hypothetical protein
MDRTAVNDVDADDAVTGTGKRHNEHLWQEDEEWNESGRVKNEVARRKVREEYEMKE